MLCVRDSSSLSIELFSTIVHVYPVRRLLYKDVYMF